MAKVDIEITLQGGVEQYDAQQFQPGDVVQGSISIYPNENVNCKHIYARLGWHTEGRGTRYTQKIDELDLYQGQLQAGMPMGFDFSFVLPNEPWSYEGHYISIIWAITVQIDVSWAKDPKQILPFILRP